MQVEMITAGNSKTILVGYGFAFISSGAGPACIMRIGGNFVDRAWGDDFGQNVVYGGNFGTIKVTATSTTNSLYVWCTHAYI